MPIGRRANGLRSARLRNDRSGRWIRVKTYETSGENKSAWERRVMGEGEDSPSEQRASRLGS